MNYQLGDVVELYSGGLPMTIMKIQNVSETYVCIWHDNNGQLQMGTIPHHCIKRTIKTW